VVVRLQEIQKELNFTVPGLVYDNNPDKLESSYGTLLPVMIKAIQDLSLKNNLLFKEIEKISITNELLFTEIKDLKNEICILKNKNI